MTPITAGLARRRSAERSARPRMAKRAVKRRRNARRRRATSRPTSRISTLERDPTTRLVQQTEALALAGVICQHSKCIFCRSNSLPRKEKREMLPRRNARNLRPLRPRTINPVWPMCARTLASTTLTSNTEMPTIRTLPPTNSFSQTTDNGSKPPIPKFLSPSS